MAINLFNKYGSRANPPSIDYPQGSVKNRSAPDVKDGTPLDADWANDHQGFFQSILSYFGVTANGTPDKVGASQYFDALMSDPTESRRGMPLAATNAEVATGENASKMVTPAGLRSAYQLPIGQGQTWQDMTSSRVVGTTYTNTTGRAIFVSVRSNAFASGGGNIFLYVNGNNVALFDSGSVEYFASRPTFTVCGIIPQGATYSVTSTNGIDIWMELR